MSQTPPVVVNGTTDSGSTPPPSTSTQNSSLPSPPLSSSSSSSPLASNSALPNTPALAAAPSSATNTTSHHYTRRHHQPQRAPLAGRQQQQPQQSFQVHFRVPPRNSNNAVTVNPNIASAPSNAAGPAQNTAAAASRRQRPHPTTTTTSTPNGTANNNSNSNNNNNSNDNSERGRPTLTFNLPPGVAPPLVSIHHGPAPALIGTTNGVTAAAGGPVTLPPLAPQPVPIRVERRGGGGKDVNKDFECAICLEYMEDPSGCGNCPSRFCYTCLSRVLNDSTSDLPKPCPTCRKPLTRIERDHAIRHRMQLTEEIICPYPGCGQELSIINAKAHEAKCDYMVMKCQYAVVGCGWIGAKKDLKRHDGRCEYGKVKGLVEQVRFMKAVHGKQIQQMQHQIMMAHRMIQAQGNTLLSIQSKSVDNVLHFFELAMTASCQPVRFLATKELWRSFFANPYRLYNFFYLFPSALVSTRTSLIGLRTILNLTTTPTDAQIDTILLSMINTCCGVSFLLCFVIDKKTCTWTYQKIATDVIYPIFRDLAALCLVIMHTATIDRETTGNGSSPSIRGVVVMSAVTIATIIFPASLAPLIAAGGVPPGTEGVTSRCLNTSRARCVVFFGLRYSILLSICGILPLWDALVYHHVLIGAVGRYLPVGFFPSTYNSDCFLSHISLGGYIGLAVMRVATIVACDGVDGFAATLPPALIALLILWIVNHTVALLNRMGRGVGVTVARQASEILGRNIGDWVEGRGSPSGRVLDGVLMFGVWVCLLGIVIVA